MTMKVWNALADPVIHRDEGPLRFHGLLDCARKLLRAGEEGLDQLAWEVHEGFMVLTRDEKYVTGKHGAHIKESQGYIVIEHDVSRLFSLDDLAEHAHRSETTG